MHGVYFFPHAFSLLTLYGYNQDKKEKGVYEASSGTLSMFRPRLRLLGCRPCR
jgi:hypothetical protein